MHEYFPLIAVGGFIGLMSVAFAVAYAFVKSKKQAFGFDRTMTDRELLKRLLSYAKPYYKRFILVLVLMIFSIAHEIISPYILG